MIFLGIDLGTSSVKVIAVNESGHLLGEGSAEYPIAYPKPGWAEQNPEDWWQGTLKAVHNLLQNPSIHTGDITSIGFSGQMHGLVALDEANQVLTPALLWCDQRTQAECDEITAHFGFSGLAETVSNQALTGFTAPKVLWLKKHQPEIFKKIRHILLPKDYIRFKLTGTYATDYSDASGMLLLDVQNKKWSQPLCDFIGVTSDMLPDLYESYEVTGTVTDEALQLLGLSNALGKISVVGGAGDQAAGAVGTGTVKEGIVSVTLGTSGVVFAAHDQFAMDEQLRLHAFCHANGRYHSMGVMLSAANCLKWWTDTVNADVPFKTLLAEAEAVPTSDQHVLFLPYLTGERTPYANPDARGTFIGMTPTTTRGHFTRAILEGVAFGLKDSLEILRAIQVPMDEIRVIGGGSKSDFWLKIIATIFNLSVRRINTDQGGALGAAILAAVGAGAFESVEEACDKIVKPLDAINPERADVQFYADLYRRYQGLYKALEPWF
ncbi:xylulokinase [Fusibacter sp. 3D3]|uniref:xylulokinase n=1 Tax=Fusibacter sp. 3D3 TaxID=1048380 RepID=UPI0008531450|nr:xylulokinase [Fusibacter sp. 3D3]GAU79555.1 xylulose kinase [Fusibacter sp. 3D3]